MIYCDKSQIVTIVYCVTIYDYYCTTLSNIQHIESSFGNSRKFFKAKKLRNKLIIQETDGRISHPSLTSDVAGSVHGLLADQRRRGALPRRPGHPRRHHPTPSPHHSPSLRCRFPGMCVRGIYPSKVFFQGFCELRAFNWIGLVCREVRRQKPSKFILMLEIFKQRTK